MTATLPIGGVRFFQAALHKLDNTAQPTSEQTFLHAVANYPDIGHHLDHGRIACTKV